MPKYTYIAIDREGKDVKSDIDADSESKALDSIRALNIFPTSIRLKQALSPQPLRGSYTKPHSFLRRGFQFRVRQSDVTEITEQFATLMSAGLPVVRSLDILLRQLRPGSLKNAISEVKEDVESGSSLSESLNKHPEIFDKLYINMVRAGEAGGVLDEILIRLASYREKAQRLQQRIISALLYPSAVISTACCILLFIMMIIIPKFEAMFKEMEIGVMPLMTRVLMGVANILVSYWYLLLPIPLVAAIALKLIVKTQSGRLFVDRIKLHLPVFGVIISKSSISRFCRTLGTLLQSGVPILEALSIIRDATGNQVVANAIGTVRDSIKQGDTIAEPLSRSGVFDDLVVNLVQVGEETGELDKMLIKVADTYDNQVDVRVGAMMSLLEPFLIIGMGFIVGFIVISLFMPIVVMMNGLGGR